MSYLNFDYVPLTFINDQEEIKKQIRNTLILIHLFERYKNPVRLEKLIEGTQYGYNASSLQSGKNKFLRISDIHESKVNWETVPYCNCDDEKTYLLNKDDILIARTGGTTGKSFKIDNPPAHSIYAGYLIRIRAKQEVNPDYIYLFLHSFAYWSQIVNLNERNFRPKANAENLKSLILPDCERSIQDEAFRISQGEKIKGYEDLFSKIEKVLSEYDKSQQVENLLSNQLTQLENLNQAILQEAVQGKLLKSSPPLKEGKPTGGVVVEQNTREKLLRDPSVLRTAPLAGEQHEEEETGHELLKRIKAEKAKLGKKEKPLTPIKPEEIPFEIPENWVWCRLGELAISISTGPFGTMLHQSDYVENGIPLVNPMNIVNEKIIPSNKMMVNDQTAQRLKTYILKTDDVVIGRRGEMGRCAVVTDNENGWLCGTGSFFLRLHNEIFRPFFIKILRSEFSKEYLLEGSVGATMNNLNHRILSNLPIPLPPLSEQKRIVAEIEKQFAKTKQLKEHIIANQQATEQLLKALLHQAFEVGEIKKSKSRRD